MGLVSDSGYARLCFLVLCLLFSLLCVRLGLIPGLVVPGGHAGLEDMSWVRLA